MRARIKTRDQMPERFMCCPKTIRRMTPYFGMEIEVSLPLGIMDRRCPFCNSDSSIGPAYRWENGRGMPVDALDIDEGLET